MRIGQATGVWVLLVAALPAFATASEIVEECASDGTCAAFAVFENGSRRPLAEGYGRGKAITKVAGSLGYVRVSCGSPCNSTIFVDFVTHEVSPSFDLVLAIDEAQRIVAYADSDPLSLVVARIFGAPHAGLRVIMNFSPVATLATSASAHFTSPGALVLEYPEGPDFHRSSAVVEFERFDLDARLR
jgi:hypothetical protein